MDAKWAGGQSAGVVSGFRQRRTAWVSRPDLHNPSPLAETIAYRAVCARQAGALASALCRVRTRGIELGQRAKEAPLLASPPPSGPLPSSSRSHTRSASRRRDSADSRGPSLQLSRAAAAARRPAVVFLRIRLSQIRGEMWGRGIWWRTSSGFDEVQDGRKGRKGGAIRKEVCGSGGRQQ